MAREEEQSQGAAVTTEIKTSLLLEVLQGRIMLAPFAKEPAISVLAQRQHAPGRAPELLPSRAGESGTARAPATPCRQSRGGGAGQRCKKRGLRCTAGCAGGRRAPAAAAGPVHARTPLGSSGRRRRARPRPARRRGKPGGRSRGREVGSSESPAGGGEREPPGFADGRLAARKARRADRGLVPKMAVVRGAPPL